jgi:hypothetical protein
LAEWLRRWPAAQLAVLTGEPSDIVAVDIDVKGERSGFDTLDDLGVSFHPERAPAMPLSSVRMPGAEAVSTPVLGKAWRCQSPYSSLSSASKIDTAVSNRSAPRIRWHPSMLSNGHRHHCANPL